MATVRTLYHFGVDFVHDRLVGRGVRVVLHGSGRQVRSLKNGLTLTSLQILLLFGGDYATLSRFKSYDFHQRPHSEQDQKNYHALYKVVRLSTPQDQVQRRGENVREPEHGDLCQGEHLARERQLPRRVEVAVAARYVERDLLQLNDHDQRRCIAKQTCVDSGVVQEPLGARECLVDQRGERESDLDEKQRSQKREQVPTLCQEISVESQSQKC